VVTPTATGRGATLQVPEGTTPAQFAGALRRDRGTGPDAVAATLLHLATRGHLRFAEAAALEPGPVTWTVVRGDGPRRPDRPSRLERAVLDRAPELPDAGEDPLPLADLDLEGADEEFEDLFDEARGTGGRGAAGGSIMDGMFWHLFAGMFLTIGGLVGTILLAVFTTWALVAAAAFLAGPVLVGSRWLELRLRRRAPKTTSGIPETFRALRSGIERATAPGLAEDGRADDYVALLPWAVAADRLDAWRDGVAGLVRSEVPLRPLDWYRGPDGAPSAPGRLAEDVVGLVAALVTAVTAPEPSDDGDESDDDGTPDAGRAAREEREERERRDRERHGSGAGSSIFGTSSSGGSSGGSSGSGSGSGSW